MAESENLTREIHVILSLSVIVHTKFVTMIRKLIQRRMAASL